MIFWNVPHILSFNCSSSLSIECVLYDLLKRPPYTVMQLNLQFSCTKIMKSPPSRKILSSPSYTDLSGHIVNELGRWFLTRNKFCLWGRAQRYQTAKPLRLFQKAVPHRLRVCCGNVYTVNLRVIQKKKCRQLGSLGSIIMCMCINYCTLTKLIHY